MTARCKERNPFSLSFTRLPMRLLIAALLLTAVTPFVSGCAYDEPRGDRGYRDDSRMERRDEGRRDDRDDRRVGRRDDGNDDSKERGDRRNDR
jgi:hypothetical protein